MADDGKPIRYPTMIRPLRRGASRAELEAELARLEQLEADDPSWIGATHAEKLTIRQRLGFLDGHGRDRERVRPPAPEDIIDDGDTE